jgi:16S rRNA (adenine1518-N6/adenine1519-N6)-dimethyltransferase
MSLTSHLPTLKTTIDTHGLSTKKALGQHFLLDANIIRRIASYAGDVTQVSVIEIGPGPGGLTRALLDQGAKHLTVIEKDERCLPILYELCELAKDRMEIVSEDALKVDLMKIPAPRKIVANLPYNVGTELLLHWLGDVAKHGPRAYQSLTLMFQKEVAERIAAEPGNKAYGRLSIICQFLCDVRYDMELPPGAFSPPPKVSSAVVTLVPREKPLFDVPKEALEKVVAAAFGQRRKMLRSALKVLHVSAEILLKSADIDGSLRAEQLELVDFGKLTKAYLELTKPSANAPKAP